MHPQRCAHCSAGRSHSSNVTERPPPALSPPPTAHTLKPPTSALCLLDSLLVSGLQGAPGACGSAGSGLYGVRVEARGTQVLQGLATLEKLEGATFDLYSFQRAGDLGLGCKHWSCAHT